MSVDAGISGAAPFGRYERMLAMRYLRSRRAHGGVTLITLISFLGIMLAVAVLIIVMSVMNGFRTELISKFIGVDNHIEVNARALDADTVESMARGIERAVGVENAAPILVGQAMFQANGGAIAPLIFGIDQTDLASVDLVRQSIDGGPAGVDPALGALIRGAGSLDTFGEGPGGGEEIVIGRGVANILGLRVGDQVRLTAPSLQATPFGATPRNKLYTIGAIFSVGHPEFDRNLAFMPLEQARLFFAANGRTDFIGVRVTDPERVEDYVDGVREAVGPGARVSTWRDTRQSLVNALIVERNVMRLILMMLVLIAALNIISGLVMLVKNKARDIAILRTMGATRGGVMRVFFLAGALVGMLGTAAGLAAGVAFCLNIPVIQAGIEVFTGPLFPPEIYGLNGVLPARLEWAEVALVGAWGFAVSSLVTLLPSWWASRLDPVEALRYE